MNFAHRIVLLLIFGIWVLVAWGPLSQQFSALEQWQARLENRSLPERTALLDYPAYIVAEQVKPIVPANACILFIAYTGPEHVNFYKTRFDYYLYPRRVRVAADTGVAPEGCEYIGVFRDSPQNLAVEPFGGHWDEEQLRYRLAGLERVHAGQHLELYRSRP